MYCQPGGLPEGSGLYGKTNDFGSLNVLELARRNRARVLLTSTSEVYGDALVHPQSDPRRRCPDITLAKQVLNWQPKVSLDEGLMHTIAFYQIAAAITAAAKGKNAI
jgi:nucleoside-diphosphate-sugar epimerase